MELKLTAWGHIKMLLPLIVFSCGSTCLYIWLVLPIEATSGGLFIFFSIYFMLFYFPVLYIHLSYYSRNSGITYAVSNKGITKNEHETETFYSVNDFDFIEIIMTKRKRHQLSGKHYFYFTHYYHAMIHLKNSEYLIITSLYPQKVEKVLNDTFKHIATIKYTDCLYPSIVDYKVY